MWNNELQEQIKNKKLTNNDKIKEFAVYCVVILLTIMFALFLTQYAFISVEVSGTSMQPTFETGDKLYMTKLKKLEIKDVIVIEVPKSKDPYIKRLFGFEGDELWCSGGVLYRRYTDKDGNRVIMKFEEEKYADRTNFTDFPKITVPKGEVFFLGDNRDNSEDSRRIGTLPKENILGVVPSYIIKNKEFVGKYL